MISHNGHRLLGCFRTQYFVSDDIGDAAKGVSFLLSSWTLAERRASGRVEIEIVWYSQIVKEGVGRVTRGDAGERKLWDSFNAGERAVESGRMDEI